MAKIRTLHSTGNHDLFETDFELPDPGLQEVQVKTKMTGVCRSDIDWYTGAFPDLGLGHFGHEGIGEVIKVGPNVRTFKVGDLVSTVKSDPCYGDYYNAHVHNTVAIPKIAPEYILEPVACAINIGYAMINNVVDTYDERVPILILGSGFLATVIYRFMSSYDSEYRFHVVGQANRHYWVTEGVRVYDHIDNLDRKFTNIIDLSDKPEYFGHDCIDLNASIILAAEKHPAVNTTFGELLWKSVSIVCPSPRDKSFQQAHEYSLQFVEENKDMLQLYWTKEYDRDREYQQAFFDGLNRPENYSRGYITWK